MYINAAINGSGLEVIDNNTLIFGGNVIGKYSLNRSNDTISLISSFNLPSDHVVTGDIFYNNNSGTYIITYRGNSTGNSFIGEFDGSGVLLRSHQDNIILEFAFAIYSKNNLLYVVTANRDEYSVNESTLALTKIKTISGNITLYGGAQSPNCRTYIVPSISPSITPSPTRTPLLTPSPTRTPSSTSLNNNGTVELSPQNGLNTGTYAVFVNGVFDGTFKSGSRTYIQGTTIRIDYQNPTCNVTLNGSNYSSATDITINGNTTNTFVLNNADYWFDLGTGYCDNCVSYKNQQNGCGSGRSVIGGSFCNVTANYNTSIGTYCENCTNYVVYQNSNPCFTGNQYYVNGTSYATNPSNGGCNYNANYSTPVGTYCQDCVNHTIYQNTNGCFTGNQFSIPSLGQTYQDEPSNSTCNYSANWEYYSQICNGTTLEVTQVDTNPCSSTYGQFQTITTQNSTTCGYSPCSCYTIATNDSTITYTYGRCGSTQNVTTTLNGGQSINVCSRYTPTISSGVGSVDGGSVGCSSNNDCQ